jgi:hypothetical protein
LFFAHSIGEVEPKPRNVGTDVLSGHLARTVVPTTTAFPFWCLRWEVGLVAPVRHHCLVVLSTERWSFHGWPAAGQGDVLATCTTIHYYCYLLFIFVVIVVLLGVLMMVGAEIPWRRQVAPCSYPAPWRNLLGRGPAPATINNNKHDN